MSDDELAARVKNDDQHSFELLYFRYNKKLFYFSLKYLQNKVEAEDLVQTVFVSLWENRKSFDESLSIKSYIYKSLSNLIFNCYKRRAIQSQYMDYASKRTELYSNMTYETIYLHDLEQSIHEIVTTLPPQQQRIFQMSRRNGYSYEKIAQKLNISIRTVENQIYRTMKLITKNLALKS
jgi:RNA polymerase sigma-70 factor (ECF subfamily)